jgi:D-tyrosyl-tRNA(Tyr) deacylase
MIALIQRVTDASVTVVENGTDRPVGQIGPGIVALIGMEPDDDANKAERLLTRILGYRIFADDQGRMNRSLTDLAADGNQGGGLLLVPNFTLAADTNKGTRPGFSTALSPALAAPLFEHMVTLAQGRHPTVVSGVFAAHMKISLTNDGPVTLRLTV